jgi:hypothetical protein
MRHTSDSLNSVGLLLPRRHAIHYMTVDTGRADTERATDLIEGGADLAGASIGAAVGLIGGPELVVGGAAAGVVATRVFRRVGSELHQRLLGPRHRVRVGAAFAVAADTIVSRLDAGEVLRQDGFFEDSTQGRPASDEVLEGVLQAAGAAFEERKIPFLGKLYASVAFDSSVTRPQANFFIAVAERLTFRQVVLLAVIARGDVQPLAADAANGHPPRQLRFSEKLGLEADDLERRGLIGHGPPGDAPEAGARAFVEAGRRPVTEVSLTRPGEQIHELMGLRDVSDGARQEVLADLDY